MLKNMKLGKKFLLAFLAVGVIPFAVIGLMSLNSASMALSKQAFNQLEGVREIKKAQIEQFFAERERDLGVLEDTVSSLQQEAEDKLNAVKDIKREAVERYFQSIRDQILTFSSDLMVVNAMRHFKGSFRTFRYDNVVKPRELKNMRSELLTYYTGDFDTEYKNKNDGKSSGAEDYFNQLDDDSIALQYHYIKANKNPLGSKHLLDAAKDLSNYSENHAYYHPVIREFLEKFGYYDIFLVDPETGDIVYSVFKELDYSTSLIDGPYAKTNFGEAFRQANEATEKDAVALIDYEFYPPSYEAAASFIASPIYDGNKKVGILIFQMPVDRINAIVQARTGLGKTGENYLVGEVNGESFYRSERVVKKGKIGKKKSGSLIFMALAGKSGAGIKVGSTGSMELAAYAPLKIPGLHWAIMGSQSLEETIAPILEGETEDYFTKYIKKYGYYDLFLINKNGFCFYTVAKEADYKTNFVDGKFSDSNLGELTRKVLKTKEIGIADFAPYAPSNGEPAAFIAQPILRDGKVELIVALQLSLEAINKIMTRREGMGETGETYLIGSDKLMRSDSFLDPKHHTVKTSFADPSKGGVDTEAASEALAGKSDTKIITDYNGNPVLSAYTSIKVGDTVWGLLAEMDESEAFAAIKKLEWLMAFIAIIGIIAIVVVALLITRSITGPVQKSVELAKAMATGDFSQRIELSTGDEIGELGNSLDQMAGELSKMVTDIKDNADKLASASQELSTVSTQMASNSEETAHQSETVAGTTEQMSTNIVTMASAAEEMSVNINGVSSAAEQMSTNVNTVASAIEEMSSSINGVSSNADEAGKVSDEATEKAVEACATMQSLAEAAREIGQVIDDIKRIAEQTNLLALNATIEAASAGDAGRGFAVVANEVKELANQSAQAAENITNRIAGVQENTSNAVSAIEEIAKTISGVNDLQSNITSSVNEQTKTANEIASNISEAAKGANNIASSISEISKGSSEVSKNAGEAAKGANDVSSNIQGVNTAARDTSTGATQINSSSEDLAKMATELQDMVSKFKTS